MFPLFATVDNSQREKNCRRQELSVKEHWCSRQDTCGQKLIQGHPTDRFGGISVRKTCNRLKFSVREMSSRAFLINAFCFRRDKNDVLGTKIGQLGISERQ